MLKKYFLKQYLIIKICKSLQDLKRILLTWLLNLRNKIKLWEKWNSSKFQVFLFEYYKLNYDANKKLRTLVCIYDNRVLFNFILC